jgi:5-hydroxyisourate hydrolase-like protein (transthyretin family)
VFRNSNFLTKLLSAYFSEQSRWIHWFPVGLLFGIAIYFTLSTEPGWFVYVFLFFLATISIVCVLKNPNFRLASYIIIGICTGFCLMGERVHFNTTQMKGRIESIENHPYKNDGTYRFVLDQVHINDAHYSAKLRLNISEKFAQNLEIHDQLNVEGTIYPIPMPSSLHGYFARRAAYLQNIGGTASVKKVLNHKKAEKKPFAQYRHALTQNYYQICKLLTALSLQRL